MYCLYSVFSLVQSHALSLTIQQCLTHPWSDFRQNMGPFSNVFLVGGNHLVVGPWAFPPNCNSWSRFQPFKFWISGNLSWLIYSWAPEAEQMEEGDVSFPLAKENSSAIGILCALLFSQHRIKMACAGQQNLTQNQDPRWEGRWPEISTCLMGGPALPHPFCPMAISRILRLCPAFCEPYSSLYTWNRLTSRKSLAILALKPLASALSFLML